VILTENFLRESLGKESSTSFPTMTS